MSFRSACAPVCHSPKRQLFFALAPVLLFGVALAPGSALVPGAAVLRVGLAGSLVRDLPEPMIVAAAQPLRAQIEAQTGVKVEISRVADWHELGEQLASGQLALGVFQGFELAWARQKQPKLSPLVIAVNQRQHLHAHLLVRHDCAAADLAGLKDQCLALPKGSREHCRLFCERSAQACGREAAPFTKLTTPGSAEEALDDVVDGVAQAAVVDGLALECYRRRKPGRFVQLKELTRSEAFPAAAIVYQAAALDDAQLRCFRQGLLAFKQTPQGRQTLLMWRLTAFEAVPSDYEQRLASIAKAYPPPRRCSSVKSQGTTNGE